MRMVWIAGFCALAVQASSAFAAGMDPQGAVRHHFVVVHVNAGDAAAQKGSLNNVRHLFEAIGREHLTVEVVAHGAGLAMLTKTTTSVAQELAQLRREYGVAVTACSNTMKSMHLTRDQLVDEVGDTVPAMVRLMERQEQGWVYIKP